MDKNARLDHPLNLLGLQKDHLVHLQAQRKKLDSHHASRERDRAILQNTKDARRSDKAVRSLERAVRNDEETDRLKAGPGRLEAIQASCRIIMTCTLDNA